MENSINQRINAIMESKRMNINTFSKAIGKSYNSINSIVKGLTKPGYDLLEAIVSTFPDLNPTWLLSGNGQMYMSEVKQVEPTADSYLKEHLHTLEENFNRLASQLETKDDQIKSKDTQIDRLTRMLESVLGKPSDVTAAGSVVRVHPATQQIVEPVGATA